LCVCEKERKRELLESALFPSCTLSDPRLCVTHPVAGTQGQSPKRGGFSWEELHTLNQQVPWNGWVNAVLSEHESGQLLGRKPGVGNPIGR
jgi:hypothetical protein